MSKKPIMIFMLSFIVLFGANAQAPPNDVYTSSQIIFEGYLIRVLPLNNNGFGYNIYFKNRLIVQQTINPFNLSPIGLKSKDDAYRIAKWQVQQLHQRRGVALIKNQRISKDVAKQLKVRMN